MDHARVRVTLRIFRLPACVDDVVLDAVIDELVTLDRDCACVLEFSSTRHIRFRDLQRFSRIVRDGIVPVRPILLAGLSDYCERIVRYALGAEDWERFRVVAGLDAVVPAGGMPATPPRVRLGTERGLGSGFGGFGELPFPSMN